MPSLRMFDEDKRSAWTDKALSRQACANLDDKLPEVHFSSRRGGLARARPTPRSE